MRAPRFSLVFDTAVFVALLEEVLVVARRIGAHSTGIRLLVLRIATMIVLLPMVLDRDLHLPFHINRDRLSQPDQVVELDFPLLLIVVKLLSMHRVF